MKSLPTATCDILGCNSCSSKSSVANYYCNTMANFIKDIVYNAHAAKRWGTGCPKWTKGERRLS